MTREQFNMSPTQIAEFVGTVGSPLIVVSELLKNAVDASATNIDIYYNREERFIAVENDYKGFTIEEIKKLAFPGTSSKKRESYLTNERGMFLTGSKGLGLLSVFLLCEYAEIYTSPADHKVYKIILDKNTGSVEQSETEEVAESNFTKVILKKVEPEIIDFLSSESEVRKLRHICTNLYKSEEVPFPKMRLHISGQDAQEINFWCKFPQALYDVRFRYHKESQELYYCCLSPDKPICEDEVVFAGFDLESMQKIMLEQYGIKETIATRTNETVFSDFSGVPTFEGRILVYERNLAGAQLKTYGAGVNIYVNEFALYNYLAEENDWLGLADYSQRKKATRLKPHNVFGYVNFPTFDENRESLRISNERADFIQNLTFSKLMYLLKGVVMFATFNIDVADKNPKYKDEQHQEQGDSGDGTSDTAHSSEDKGKDKPGNDADQDSDYDSDSESEKDGSGTGDDSDDKDYDTSGPYSPDNLYKPKRVVQKCLVFTAKDGKIIDALRDTDDLSNKIYNLVFELSKLDLQVHRHSIAYLYRALLESSTKFFTRIQPKAAFNESALETSVINVLNYFGNVCRKNEPLSLKTIQTWRDTIAKRKLIDTLNQYVHKEQPVDATLLQETWNTMKGYIIACLTMK